VGEQGACEEDVSAADRGGRPQPPICSQRRRHAGGAGGYIDQAKVRAEAKLDGKWLLSFTDDAVITSASKWCDS
jgi:hypothetical protein